MGQHPTLQGKNFNHMLQLCLCGDARYQPRLPSQIEDHPFLSLSGCSML